MDKVPSTAGTRTMAVRRALEDAGYPARVTSSPASHRAQVTTVDRCEQLDDAATYLRGYLSDLADVEVCGTGFAQINWRITG